MAVKWTNNSNDGQSSDTVTFGVSSQPNANVSSGSTTITVSSIPAGEFKVGHEFYEDAVGQDFSNSTLYSITSITERSGDAAVLVITPALVATLSANTQFRKEDDYRGNQGSAENHLRLRNQGQI